MGRRSILQFLLAFYCLAAAAGVYHVSPGGNDGGAGTQEDPWGSWTKGFLSARAGDTVYIHGGTYPIYTRWEMVEVRYRSGKSGRPISVMNYPGEQPVLDLAGMDRSLCCINGLLLSGCSHWHVRGLRVVNVVQPDDGTCIGIDLRNCEDVTLENMSVYNVGGDGIGIAGAHGLTQLINCDASLLGSRDGENGNGITFSFTPDISAVAVARGCRAWNCLDDGFDCWEFDGLVLFEECWAFGNGLNGGDGDGFKLGKSNGGVTSQTLRILKNCLAFDNFYTGFDHNGCEGVKKFYHCVAYRNGYAGYTADNNPEDYFRNNISYQNDYDWFMASADHSHNSWDADPPVQVSDADFLSLDPTGMDGPRDAEGNLPELDFLHLAEGSDLVDAGEKTGFGYYGAAPDLGAFEYDQGTGNNVYHEPEILDLAGLIGTGYQVFDLSGRRVKQAILYSSFLSYELADLPRGIYLILFEETPDEILKYFH